MARDLKRLNINLPAELIKKVDEYAETLYIPRTTAMTVLLNSALDSQRAMKDINELVIEMKKQQELEEKKPK